MLAEHLEELFEVDPQSGRLGGFAAVGMNAGHLEYFDHALVLTHEAADLDPSLGQGVEDHTEKSATLFELMMLFDAFHQPFELCCESPHRLDVGSVRVEALECVGDLIQVKMNLLMLFESIARRSR